MRTVWIDPHEFRTPWPMLVLDEHVAKVLTEAEWQRYHEENRLPDDVVVQLIVPR